jgi:hypothetical protein
MSDHHQQRDGKEMLAGLRFGGQASGDGMDPMNGVGSGVTPLR